MFTEQTDFMNFRNICQKDNIEYHMFTINSKKTYTGPKRATKSGPKVVLIGLPEREYARI